jgi:hypothetical protein
MPLKVIKFIPVIAVETYKVVRFWGSHNFQTVGSQREIRLSSSRTGGAMLPRNVIFLLLVVISVSIRRRRKCFWEVERGRRIRLTNPLPSVCRLSRQCGILNIAQSYRSPRPVTFILFAFTVISCIVCQKSDPAQSCTFLELWTSLWSTRFLWRGFPVEKAEPPVLAHFCPQICVQIIALSSWTCHEPSFHTWVGASVLSCVSQLLNGIGPLHAYYKETCRGLNLLWFQHTWPPCPKFVSITRNTRQEAVLPPRSNIGLEVA